MHVAKKILCDTYILIPNDRRVTAGEKFKVVGNGLLVTVSYGRSSLLFDFEVVSSGFPGIFTAKHIVVPP